MRVLIISSRFPDVLRPNAGNIVEHQTLSLAQRPDVEVEVVAPIAVPPFPLSLQARNRRLSALPAVEDWKGLRVHRPRYTLPLKLPGAHPFLLRRRLLPLLEAIRRNFPFDVLAGQFFWPEGPAVVALGAHLGVPVSLKGRGPDVETSAKHRWAGPLIVKAGSRADGLLAVNAELKRHMEMLGMPGERIAVHYTGIDRGHFKPGRAAAKRTLAREGPLLLSVGNLIPRKGHDLAIEALTHLPGVRLAIVGNGPLLPELRAQAREFGVDDRVEMLGLVSYREMPTLYAAADVTVHAASIEGFANVRVESLACGTPVVTTAAGGAEELIKSPDAGAIVPRNARAIAAAAGRLIRDPPQPDAVLEAVAAFSWERNAIELEAHLLGLLPGRRGPAR
jgi:teichuronic acid biosynthesis glycosyltransferase TuaC